jgi:hypothetical protein
MQSEPRGEESRLKGSNRGLNRQLVAWIRFTLSGVFSITLKHKIALTARGNPKHELSGGPMFHLGDFDARPFVSGPGRANSSDLRLPVRIELDSYLRRDVHQEISLHLNF